MKDDKWILASEKLPDINYDGGSENVLVHKEGEHRRIAFLSRGTFESYYWVTSEGARIRFDFTDHWQPLPELPAKREDRGLRWRAGVRYGIILALSHISSHCKDGGAAYNELMKPYEGKEK